MSYTLVTGEPVSEAVRRVAGEQLDDAIDDLSDAISDDPTEAIHDARKRCKKVRGLVRAVRPALGDDVYRVANDTARDAARELSDLRDATALTETFRIVVEASDLDLSGDDDTAVAARTVDHLLTERHLAAASELAADHPRVERARDLLLATRAESGGWDLDDQGWDALAGGIEKTYERGRSAFRTSAEAPTADNFHEWRKRVKYSWYHLRLVGDVAPTVLDPLADGFHDLADALGDAHDMVVLSETLGSLGDDVCDLAPVERLLGGYRSVLEQRSLALGARLFAEPKSAFVERLGRYWSANERFGPECDVGEIETLW
ncbi:MAG TPA: CHAD domain-containing protein [Ilumatobacteraceae bacterium]|nr:CHAD domain-containing protein [Ilumatobacteraceae bacterium]